MRIQRLNLGKHARHVRGAGRAAAREARRLAPLQRLRLVPALTGVALGLAAAVYGTLAARRRFDLSGKVVVVSGGSRGLGFVLARRYAEQGGRVAILARSAEELIAARTELRSAGHDARVFVADVADPAQVRVAIERVEAALGPVDVLVNVAGDISVGPVLSMTADDFERALQTNFWGPLRLMHAVLPGMRARGAGRIVNVSSIGGVVGVPHLAPYCASKFALTGLSRSLRPELANDGVYVTTVCPWLTRTGSFVHAFFKGDRSAELAWFKLSSTLPVLTMSAERAARRIVRATVRGEARVILAVQGKVAALAETLVPGVLSAVMAATNRVLPSATGASGLRAEKGFALEARA